MAVGVLVAIGVLLVIIDMMTGTFYMLLLGIASILSAIILYLSDSYFVTFLSFLVISFVLWIGTQKFGKTIQGEDNFQSGVDALIGKEVKVHTVSEEEPTEGTCQVYGDEWSIKSEIPLTMGETVIVTHIKGVTLFVKNEEKESE